MEEQAGSTGGTSLEERYFITALARGLEVLSCFTADDKALSHQAIAKRCKLPKSTVTRITFTLTKLGYLNQLDENGGRFALGLRTVALGSAALSRMEMRHILRPLMQAVADETNTTVSLGIREGLSMIYVEVCRSASAVNLIHQVGTRIPIAGTAMGRAYLAQASELELRDVYQRARELDELAYERLRADRERALADIQTLGCAQSFGDWNADVNAIALAFNAPHMNSVMVVSCGGVATRTTREHLVDNVSAKLRDMVAGLRV